MQEGITSTDRVQRADIEIDTALVDFVTLGIASRKTKFQIKRDLEEKLKVPVSMDAYEILCRRAREAIGLIANRSKKTNRELTLAWLDFMQAQDDVQLREKIKLEEMRAKICGYDGADDAALRAPNILAVQIQEALKEIEMSNHLLEEPVNADLQKMP